MGEPYYVWLLIVHKIKSYKTYNQITNEFDVYIMQLSKGNYQFKLVKKLDGDKPPKITLRQLIVDLANRLDAIEKKIDTKIDELDKRLSARLDAIVKANHLIDPSTK